jgi:hypothetical protein
MFCSGIVVIASARAPAGPLAHGAACHRHIVTVLAQETSMRTLIIALCLIAACANAMASDVDWKMYGAASVDGPEICFYDAMGVAATPDKHVRVWTKCLPQQDLDNTDTEHDFEGTILNHVVEKVAHRYLPPIASVENIDGHKRLAITLYEETADIADIQPHSRIYYEIDCAQKMLRELSISFSVNGKRGSREKPSEWKYIPPEGNGATLFSLLCLTQ